MHWSASKKQNKSRRGSYLHKISDSSNFSSSYSNSESPGMETLEGLGFLYPWKQWDNNQKPPFTKTKSKESTSNLIFNHFHFKGKAHSNEYSTIKSSREKVLNTSNHSQLLNLLNDLEKKSNQFNKLTNQKMSLIFKSDYQTGIHKYAEYLVVPENGLYKPSNLRINHSIRNYLPEEQKARIPIFRVPSNRRYHQTE